MWRRSLICMLWQKLIFNSNNVFLAVSSLKQKTFKRCQPKTKKSDKKIYVGKKGKARVSLISIFSVQIMTVINHHTEGSMQLPSIFSSVRSQSKFFDLTQVDQVVTNRLDLSRSSTWNRLGKTYLKLHFFRQINAR